MQRFAQLIVAVVAGLTLQLTSSLLHGAEEGKVLETFKLSRDNNRYVMKSVDCTLRDHSSSATMPWGFVVPEKYCNRSDLDYVIRGTIRPDWNGAVEKSRNAVFSFGVNVSGSEPDSVSLVFLNGTTLLARIYSTGRLARGQVLKKLDIKSGQKYNFEMRINSHMIDLHWNGKRIGVATIGSSFSWAKNRILWIGGERLRTSVFKGKISDLSLRIVKNTATKQSKTANALLVNPYNRGIIGAVKGRLLSGSEYFEKKIASEKNIWLFRNMAENTMAVAYCYTLKGCEYYKSPEVLKYLNRTILYLAQKREDFGWIKRKGNDPNVNRFTLLPYIEAVSMVASDLAPEVKTAALNRIGEELERQRKTHGAKLASVDRIYPNMNVYYMLAMFEGAKLLNNKSYYDESFRILKLLEKTQYPDGAWPYIMTTNENIGYHDIVVGVLARFAALSKSPEAMKMVRKSIPFYKLSIGASGIPEYVTDPFWKHNWSSVAPQGPEIVAGITGDAQNKWIASLGNSGGAGLLDVYAAIFWKDIKPEPIKSGYVVMDRNVDGPRGAFPGWNWVCSARYGSDTLVGCYGKVDGQLKGLLRVSAEIANTRNGKADSGSSRYALGMPPKHNTSITKIDKDSATFSSEYKMGSFRNIWGVEPYPFDWTCRQEWKLDREQISGEIVFVSGADQQSPPPVIRFVFGKGGSISKVSHNTFEYKPYILTFEKNDLTDISFRNVPVSVFNKNKLNGRELLLALPGGNKNYRKGESFKVKVTLKRQ